MSRKLALASLSALVALTMIAPVSALTFAVPASTATTASAAAVAAVGTVDFTFPTCSGPDTVPFTASDNTDGTWTFNFVDVGNPDCPWAETGAAITATGSPATGFSGGVTSAAWTVNGNDFTASLSVTMDLGSTLSGNASGKIA